LGLPIRQKNAAGQAARQDMASQAASFAAVEPRHGLDMRRVGQHQRKIAVAQDVPL
jgi:hypothetical protein